MAKMLMIQMQNAPYFGTAYLCGAARSRGHEFVLHLGMDLPGAVAAVKRENPDLVGFSCMSSFTAEVLRLARGVKAACGSTIVVGGPHPTFFPEVIEDEGVDIICRGEGEFALADLLDALDRKSPISGIANLWVKEGDHIHRNDPRPLADPMDTLPVIDWSCYRSTPAVLAAPQIFPIRGCPYDCTYCFNASYRELYKGLGKPLRHFSVERAIRELRLALETFTKDTVIFASDSFGGDLDWMEAFFDAYEKETDRPFALLLRPELATPRCLDIVARHRCQCVALGVESGSERVRRDLLNRRYSNEYLMGLSRRLKERGLKFRTYNIIGLPGETQDEVWETIRINQAMGADFPRGAIFSPMPGTRLTESAVQGGYLDASFSSTCR